MGGVNAGNTKKKMAAIANQFEDAEEDTEELENSPKEEAELKDSEPTKETKPEVVDEEKKPEGKDGEEEEEEEGKQVKEQKTPQDKDGEEEKTKPEGTVEEKEADDKDTEKEEEEEEEEEEEGSPSKEAALEEAPAKDDGSQSKKAAVEDPSEEKTVTPPSTSPPPPNKGSDSPLDALASACAAEKLLKQQKIPQANPPKEGTKVRADEICCTDVLCGRGGQSNHHPGNIFFRRLVRAKQEEYLKANKREKTVVAKDIVKLIRLLTPAGRFLKKDNKDESFYVDVGDVQARNKASQALREGAPELREELRDQHSRLNAQNGGGPEVKLPYHGHKGSASSNEDKDGGRKGISRKEREALAARAAAAQGLMLPHFGVAGGAEGMVPPGLRGGADPPDGSDDDADASKAAVSAAAMHAAAAEERARRLMLAGGAPGLGPAAHMLNPHLAGLGGLGGAHMNPFLAGHSPAAAQLHAAAALQAGGSPFLSPQALMMAAAAGHPPPNAAMLLQASRARELAHMEAAGYGAGVNPLFLGGQARAAAQAQFQDSMRLHELMASAGTKREREEIEREIEEKYSKAAKRSRQFPM